MTIACSEIGVFSAEGLTGPGVGGHKLLQACRQWIGGFACENAELTALRAAAPLEGIHVPSWQVDCN